MSKSVLTNYPHDKAAQGQSIAEMGHALAEIRQASLEIAPASDMAALRQAVFGITGMDCADCAAKLERVVSRLDGVAQARVNFATAKMDVRFKPGAVSTEAIVQTVRGMGYDVSEARMADRAKPQVFRLTGLECADCAEKLEKKLSAIPGVEKAQVNFGASKLTVSTALAPERIAKAVAEAGYGAIFEGGKTSRTTIFRLKGLDCADCAAKVQKRVSLLDGVESAEVNFGASKMTVVGPVVPAAVIKAVNESGYSATIEGTGGTTRTTQFRVLGMDCADCATKLEKRLSVLPGVSKAAVNFGAGKLTVEHSAPISAIVKAVDEAGFYAEPEVVEKKTVEEAPFWRRNFRTVLTAVSALSVGVGFLLEWFKAPEAYAIAAYLVAMISGGFFVARAGIYGLKARTLDTNFLMTVAAVGAAAIGQWSEGAVVVMLFSLGNTLQAYTMDKTRQSIRALMELAPKEALVRRDGIEMRLPVEEILVGDVIVVRPGEKIAMDGVVRAGASAVNQAPITGESLPVEKTVGDEVFAGTINEQGSLEVSVTRLAEDNTLSKIMNMVEEAQAQKAPSQQFVDVFAKYYTPAIILAAMGIAVVPWLFGAPFQIWFYRALVLLVIACPCALVISTPVSIVAAIGNASRNGVLIKGGAYLEEAGALRAVAFDKTGTLTAGKPSVTDVIPIGGRTENQILEIAGAIEGRSEHPLAQAIVTESKAKLGSLPEPAEFQALTGKGATARVAGESYFIGNPRLFNELGVNLGEVGERLRELQSQGKTAMILGTEREVIGIIAVADQVRANAKAAVAGLRQAGIQEVIMLTGDNPGTAKAIADELDLTQFRAELLPQDKVSTVKDLLAKYGKVAMIGDGVNDAPALASATVGIAMGAAGTDTALETADIVLMSDDLSRLPYVMSLSRRALAIIKENIAFSLVVKAAFLVLTMVGMANLWMAVFADTGAALIVIANGMRLARMSSGSRSTAAA